MPSPPRLVISGSEPIIIVKEASVPLRPYQKKAIADVYNLIRSGIKRAVIFAPTGAGKTVIASQIMSDAVSRFRRILFIVHRDILVSQTADKLRTFGLSENIGYIKSGWQENQNALIQIASVQTLPFPLSANLAGSESP
jgi:superfamily II DNA or RNA helicase